MIIINEHAIITHNVPCMTHSMRRTASWEREDGRDPVINEQSSSYSISKKHLTQLIIFAFLENFFHLASCHYTLHVPSQLTGHSLSVVFVSSLLSSRLLMLKNPEGSSLTPLIFSTLAFLEFSSILFNLNIISKLMTP